MSNIIRLKKKQKHSTKKAIRARKRLKAGKN